MDFVTMQMALQFGNGSYLRDRSGIGRFGMGLPNASISQAGHVDIWSWQNGPDNALYTYLDVKEIEAGKLQVVPEPCARQLPQKWREISSEVSRSGTLVLWSKLEFDRLTWKRAKATLSNVERLVGRIYRKFIIGNDLRIQLRAYGEENHVILEKSVIADDPLYLTPSAQVPAPFNEKPMFEFAFDERHPIEYRGTEHIVRIVYSVARKDTIDEAGDKNRGDMPYGKHAGRNIGVSVVRAGRELTLDPGWCIGYDPRERWWGAEVEFPPDLDEIFGVTNNKQAATHFSELASLEWEQLKEGNEEFDGVVRRLKDEGDPRGYLLEVANGIKRSLNRLRDTIRSQRVGTGKPPRHRPPGNDPRGGANDPWTRRGPLDDETGPRTGADIVEIQDDLGDKGYDSSEIERIINLIKSENLRVIFLEADFPNSTQIFDVQLKGGITEITFNRKHPVYEYMIGVAESVDENIFALSQADVLERLVRAIFASKIVFAAWARYEREANVDRVEKLRLVRDDWGNIAARFLMPDCDL